MDAAVRDSFAEDCFDIEVADLRFRALVGEAAWAELPEPVQRRFSKRVGPDDIKLYRGRVLVTEISRAGWALAQICRVIGSPLPDQHGARGPAVVAVSADARLGGQCWTRTYTRAGRFPQVVHSAKRFTGPTGLEEYVGGGISMSLLVTVEDGALVFRSSRYFVNVGRWRVSLPRWLSPGEMEIVHRQETVDEFSFTLSLTHPLLGVMLFQLAHFSDV